MTFVSFGGNNTSGHIELAAGAINAKSTQRQDFETERLLVAPRLDASYARLYGQNNQHIDSGAGLFTTQPSGVRRLTPRECERLQGFPDDYTAIPYRGKPAADGPRYRALGNSFAVPVVRWIGQRIQMVEELTNGTRSSV